MNSISPINCAFSETRTGFYHQGRIHSMNNVIEFLRFPPLGWIDRFRLGLTVLYAQSVRDWRQLEAISVEDWLMRWSGRRTFESIWRPMLKAKFDGTLDGGPCDMDVGAPGADEVGAQRRQPEGGGRTSDRGLCDPDRGHGQADRSRRRCDTPGQPGAGDRD